MLFASTPTLPDVKEEGWGLRVLPLLQALSIFLSRVLHGI